MKLTDAEKAKLGDMQELGEVLKVLTFAVASQHPESAPAVARALRDMAHPDKVSRPALVLLWELADGIDQATGVATDQP